MIIDFWVDMFWLSGHVIVLVSSLALWVHFFTSVYAFHTRLFYWPRDSKRDLFFLFIVNSAIFRHYWLML